MLHLVRGTRYYNLPGTGITSIIGRSNDREGINVTTQRKVLQFPCGGYTRCAMIEKVARIATSESPRAVCALIKCQVQVVLNNQAGGIQSRVTMRSTHYAVAHTSSLLTCSHEKTSTIFSRRGYQVQTENSPLSQTTEEACLFIHIPGIALPSCRIWHIVYNSTNKCALGLIIYT